MILKLRVRSNSKEQSVENKGDYYLVRLKSAAKGGKANIELLKLLKKYFKKNSKIIKGVKSKDKLVELN
ncbi:MAG: DUF167 domain-containing protein [Nanoarchaeota archaeon]|nr:DUF167 domain-containing protein [Nanoarchaeota archaeon]MBU1028446.1 DUF167 domain-containing protein [Nanoarchaeota archaeon]